MAIIIETCPKCGHDLTDVMIATYPPSPKKECWNCGWSWTGEQEEVIRVPFGGNANTVNTAETKTLNDYLNADYHNYEDLVVSKFEQSACVNCSNNPKNGGSGICFCTLGQPQITC